MDGCARCCETSERRGLTRSGSLVPGPFQVNGSSGRSMLKWSPACGWPWPRCPATRPTDHPQAGVAAAIPDRRELRLLPEPGSPSAAASPVAIATGTPTASGYLILLPEAFGKARSALRFVGKNKMGFYPLPLSEAQRIRRFIQFPGTPSSAMTPVLAMAWRSKLSPVALR